MRRLYERLTGRPWTTVRMAGEEFGPLPGAVYRKELARFTDAELYAYGEEILAALRGHVDTSWVRGSDRVAVGPNPVPEIVSSSHGVRAGAAVAGVASQGRGGPRVLYGAAASGSRRLPASALAYPARARRQGVRSILAALRAAALGQDPSA